MKKPSVSHPLQRLVRYARKYRGKTLAAGTYSVVNKLLDLAPPVLIGVAVDIVVKQKGSLLARWGLVDPMHQLWFLAGLTVLVWGLESVFEYAYAWGWRNLAQTVQHDLRLDTYAHIQRLDTAYFEDQSTGGMMAILNDDINQLERFLDTGANDILQVSTTALSVILIFVGISPLLALLAMLPVPFVLWGSFAFQRRIGPRYADVREQVGLLNGQLANNLSGIETIKSFTAEAYECDRIHTQSDAYRQSNKRAIALSAAFSPLIRMIIVLGFTTTLLLGGWFTLQQQMSVGAYSVLIFMTQRLLWPLTRLGQTFDLYQRAMASTTRVLNLLDTPITIPSGEQALPTPDVKGDITFDKVTFAYEGYPPVLRDFDLTLPAGQTLAIVGATGSGKSTLLRLLLRFYEPQQGRITLDDHPLDTLRLADLRGSIGLVSQNVFLFHGSVKENIAYGSFDASFEEIVTAAKGAEAHAFIEALPQGYDTLIGERGQKLSGGQRQRLSIARAILKNPPILLLDEATSAVDNETEAAIQRSLTHITADRSTILVAHRLSTIRHADTIIVLQEGQILERGTHEQLLDQNGFYARLWRVQTGERLP